jgi:ribosomal-protein-serine acetyltransferase
MTLIVDRELELELLEFRHSRALYELACAEKLHLRRWLSWLDYMLSEDFITNFITSSLQKRQHGIEFAFVILQHGKMIGRIGVYRIDKYNGVGEIGYWIKKDEEGKGTITLSTERLIKYCFEELRLNRLEIKCATDNVKSQGVPVRLGFTKEGTLREAEYVQEKFVDLTLFSKLKRED